MYIYAVICIFTALKYQCTCGICHIITQVLRMCIYTAGIIDLISTEYFVVYCEGIIMLSCSNIQVKLFRSSHFSSELWWFCVSTLRLIGVFECEQCLKTSVSAETKWRIGMGLVRNINVSWMYHVMRNFDHYLMIDIGVYIHRTFNRTVGYCFANV